jgi:hypothetical protein
MIGGEITGRTLGVTPGQGQFHPATIHWRAPGGDVGWVRLYAAPAADAEATRETLTLTAAAAGDFTFRLAVPGLAPAGLAREHWTLPGLAVRLETDAGSFAVLPGEGYTEVRYRGATRLVLRVVPSP